MAMTNPPHPGCSIRENCLKPIGLSVTEAADALGVARHTLSRVLNGHARVSTEMAIRLELAGWSNAEFWLRRQAACDLAKARRHDHNFVVRKLTETLGKPDHQGTRSNDSAPGTAPA